MQNLLLRDIFILIAGSSHFEEKVDILKVGIIF